VLKGALKRSRVALAHGWRRAVGGVEDRALPSVLILGAQKAGSSSLFEYLMLHPDAHPPLRKEVHFFDYAYERGLDWYRAFFPDRKRMGAHGFTAEASPSYLFEPQVPERVARDLPEVRLVALLREPAMRAWSHYRHNRRKGRETLEFIEALRREAEDSEGRSRSRHFSYLSRGLYATQLSSWWHFFGRTRLLVLTSEEMFVEPDASYRAVCGFLGLREHRLAKYRVFNPGGVSDDMGPEARAFLSDYFEGPNRELETLLARSIGW
jgi:Sulfotransferase domain